MALTLTQYLISLIFCVHLVVNETEIHDADIEQTCNGDKNAGDTESDQCQNPRSTPNENISKAIKYSKEFNEKWTKYLETVTKAEEDYKTSLSESESETNNKCTKDTCSCYHSIIERDLEPFQDTGISSAMIDSARKRGVLYQIRGNELHRERECRFPARCSGVEHFLTKLARELPDMDLIINVSDYPQINSWFKVPFPPVFSFSKTKDFLDIIYPAWTFWEGGPSISIFPRGLGRWDLLRKSLAKASKKFPWEKKSSQAFFRGSRTSPERDALILLSRQNPDLADAQYTKNQAWKSDADTLGFPAAQEVSLESHCQFKYLFNYRGVAASFRFKHLFLCRSLVFHVGDEWQEFFYYLMKPWIHYVPVGSDSSVQDLKSLLEFIQAHDEIAKRIAERGYEFIKTNLRLFHVKCYWKELLTRYATLIRYPVELRSDVVKISPLE